MKNMIYLAHELETFRRVMYVYVFWEMSLHWRHNGRDSVSNH